MTEVRALYKHVLIPRYENTWKKEKEERKNRERDAISLICTILFSFSIISLYSVSFSIPTKDRNDLTHTIHFYKLLVAALTFARTDSNLLQSS